MRISDRAPSTMRCPPDIAPLPKDSHPTMPSQLIGSPRRFRSSRAVPPLFHLAVLHVGIPPAGEEGAYRLVHQAPIGVLAVQLPGVVLQREVGGCEPGV